jgi:hypothetical protein
MLDLSECRQFLDPEVSEKLSDEKLSEVRNQLCDVAELTIDSLQNQ